MKNLYKKLFLKYGKKAVLIYGSWMLLKWTLIFIFWKELLGSAW